jgi:hypothetical protein
MTWTARRTTGTPCSSGPATSNTEVWGLFDLDNPLGDEVVNERASKCLDVTDGSLQDGARLQRYNCFDSGNLAQHYTMR